MVDVGFYGRISDDPNQTLAGIDRQQADCATIASSRGWRIVRQYIDNDLSAFQRKVVRPEFEQMLADLEAGVIDGIVAYDLDRFVRQNRDLERALDIYTEHKSRSLVFASAQGDVNLQSEDGKAMARVMVTFAYKASADTGRRTARKHLELAQAGKPVGGRRPFGWKADKATLEPTEAALLREAVAELIAGATLRSIIRRWNEQGVTTTSGGQWSRQTLHRLLLNPRLVGHRTHQGKVLMDEHGQPVRGLWEPLLTPLEYDRVAQVLATPDRRSRVPRRGARHYLLTGLVRCGAESCFSPMYGSKIAEGKHNYVCDNEKSPAHRVSVAGHSLDEHVRDLVLAKMGNAELDATPAAEWHGEAALTDVNQQIVDLMDAFRSKRLTGEVVFPMVESLEREREEMRNDRAQWLARTTGPVVSRLDLPAWEAVGDADKQRAILESWLQAVVILPTAKRLGGRFDFERVIPVWQESEPVVPASPS